MTVTKDTYPAQLEANAAVQALRDANDSVKALQLLEEFVTLAATNSDWGLKGHIERNVAQFMQTAERKIHELQSNTVRWQLTPPNHKHFEVAQVLSATETEVCDAFTQRSQRIQEMVERVIEECVTLYPAIAPVKTQLHNRLRASFKEAQLGYEQQLQAVNVITRYFTPRR